MSKKGLKNGFTCFIIHGLIPDLIRAGEECPTNFQALVPLARPRYWSLSSDEKAQFENMARMERARERMAVFENQANKLVDVEVRMTLKRQRDRSNLQTTIETLTNSHECCKDDPCGHLDLLDMKFYFIGFQYMLCTEDRVYYPLEYGAVEWSMAKGIEHTIHGFINPGDIPLGYRFSVQAHSDDSHRIPLEKFPEGESDYQKIRMKLKRFLKFDDCSTPIVYCMEADYKVVTGCLSALHYQCGMTNRIRVGILEELVAVLFSHRGVELSKAAAVDMLTMSEYDFEVNVKCSKHKEVQAKFCAIGLPKKHAYTLSEALSDLYGFPLTPNHLPAARPSCEASASNQGPRRRGRGKTNELFGMSQPIPTQFKGAGRNYFFKRRWSNNEAPRNFEKRGHRGNGSLTIEASRKKVPSATSGPGPFPALSWPVASQSSLKVVEMEAQFKKLVFRDIGDGPWNIQPSFKTRSTDFSLSGFQDPFRSSGLKAIENPDEWTNSTACLPYTASNTSMQRQDKDGEHRNKHTRGRKKKLHRKTKTASFDGQIFQRNPVRKFQQRYPSDSDPPAPYQGRGFESDPPLDGSPKVRMKSNAYFTLTGNPVYFTEPGAPFYQPGCKPANIPVVDRHVGVIHPTRCFYSRRGKGQANRKR